MTKPYKCKAIRNLKSATNSSRTTGNIAPKGVNKTVKWLISDHTNATQPSSIMELQQKANFYLADVSLMNRRIKRVMGGTKRFTATGKTDIRLNCNIGLWVDHLHLLLGFIWPIVSYLLMTILMIVMFVVFNVVFTCPLSAAERLNMPMSEKKR
jgi:hypothetical protein